jgi:hypothetical protein
MGSGWQWVLALGGVMLLVLTFLVVFWMGQQNTLAWQYEWREDPYLPTDTTDAGTHRLLPRCMHNGRTARHGDECGAIDVPQPTDTSLTVSFVDHEFLAHRKGDGRSMGYRDGQLGVWTHLGGILPDTDLVAPAFVTTPLTLGSTCVWAQPHRQHLPETVHQRADTALARGADQAGVARVVAEMDLYAHTQTLRDALSAHVTEAAAVVGVDDAARLSHWTALLRWVLSCPASNAGSPHQVHTLGV